ncbi:MrcB family domain-containing protein [Allorhodopirellula heiligendammensis]|uniref:Type IV methyl-directed restriction enzyme EcoKMcrB subunit DNA-binding domain-containing protein n=1 Tax=Allorhodopirellula heiligendammensis TaxID=2714739 RepID=A0A5C6C5P5_9BACT|nr:DUF3578 domain-containing protein [Allorhodopirellula heiligendammensis]TWU19913.1 hypothetical protein Poly21_20920 [Allorhodopirellula heiligendammensis]
MSNNVNDDEVGQWAEFWEVCLRLLTIYPERPAGMSGDTEAKELERQLKERGGELLPMLCENDHWVVEASVGKGNWAAIPWVAFFDSRETTSAQRGVYPVIHISPEAPIGIRIGLGIAAKAYRGREDEKAASVWEELGDENRQELTQAGFLDVVSGTSERTPIGSGDRARRYDSKLQVGYRTRDEVILFLLNSEKMKDSFRTRDGKQVDPLDLALMMKVLPRLVGGSNAIRRTMIGLLGLAHGQSMNESEDAETAVKSWADADRPDAIEGATFPRTASRLCLMWERLSSEGYTSFWL